MVAEPEAMQQWRGCVEVRVVGSRRGSSAIEGPGQGGGGTDNGRRDDGAARRRWRRGWVAGDGWSRRGGGQVMKEEDGRWGRAEDKDGRRGSHVDKDDWSARVRRKNSRDTHSP
jgi:hypothetical protein